MRADPIGLYLHVPFCVRKCNYCDFCSFPIKEKEAYIEALISEINSYRGKGIAVDTVFFGGGTPSLLSGGQMREIMSRVRETFIIRDDAEITLEANPGTLTRDNLLAYVSLGVNRLSIGLQSIHQNELKKLGRIHNYEDFLCAYNFARECGIYNVNVDLMYGIPDQTKKSFMETLKCVTSLSPTHVSLYGLILEEGTQLYERREALTLPDEDEECDMYFAACEFMKEVGYRHYEVSNYCIEGRECRHNLKYWRGEEYIGLGLSAYSYFEGRRFGKGRDMSAYISDPTCVSDSEYIDCDTKKYEYVMLRTRLAEGFSLLEYKRLFGEDFVVPRLEKIEQFIKSGYVKMEDGRFSFTEKGLYVGNSLLTELI